MKGERKAKNKVNSRRSGFNKIVFVTPLAFYSCLSFTICSNPLAIPFPLEKLQFEMNSNLLNNSKGPLGMFLNASPLSLGTALFLVKKPPSISAEEKKDSRTC